MNREFDSFFQQMDQPNWNENPQVGHQKTYSKSMSSNVFINSNGDQFGGETFEYKDSQGNYNKVTSRSINGVSWSLAELANAQGQQLRKEKLTNMTENEKQTFIEEWNKHQSVPLMQRMFKNNPAPALPSFQEINDTMNQILSKDYKAILNNPIKIENNSFDKEFDQVSNQFNPTSAIQKSSQVNQQNQPKSQSESESWAHWSLRMLRIV